MANKAVKFNTKIINDSKVYLKVSDVAKALGYSKAHDFINEHSQLVEKISGVQCVRETDYNNLLSENEDALKAQGQIEVTKIETLRSKVDSVMSMQGLKMLLAGNFLQMMADKTGCASKEEYLVTHEIPKEKRKALQELIQDGKSNSNYLNMVEYLHDKERFDIEKLHSFGLDVQYLVSIDCCGRVDIDTYMVGHGVFCHLTDLGDYAAWDEMYVDENGDPWDMNYKHPGGEESLAINIYLKCIKGIYTVVTTPQELIAAKKNNIYLANDIDMNGAEFNILDYGKEFEGNGYTISNFSLSYDASKNALKEDLEDNSRKSLYITIFGDCKNAVIKNVNFENVSISIKTKYKPTYKIYVLPLAKTLENTKIENVKFSGSVTIVELPEEFNKETNLIVVTDEIYYSKDDKSTIENCGIKLNEKPN